MTPSNQYWSQIVRQATGFGRILILLFVIIASGCSTHPQEDLHNALVAVSTVDVPGGSNVSNEKADIAFREVIGKCATVLNKLESRGDRRRTKLFAVAITGAIAGSVAAPAVIASDGSMALSAGLAGLSGAANTTQQLIGDEGYSRTELILARENIVTRLNNYVDQWLRLEGVSQPQTSQIGRSKINAKIGILNGMVVACSMYPLGPTQPSEAVKQLIDKIDVQSKAEGDAAAQSEAPDDD
jgi:hypothetical protein